MRSIIAGCVLGSLIGSTGLVQAQWAVEEVGTGSKPEIAVGPQGAVHIAYVDERRGGALYYGRRSTERWIIEVPHEGYFYAPLDLAIDGDGFAHIAYHDHDTADLSYATNTVPGWLVENVQDPGHDGWDASIAVDETGRVHVTSIDPVMFGSDVGVEYAVRDDLGWTVEEVGSGPIPYAFGTSLALDHGGRPHVTYHDGDDNFGGADGHLLYAIRADVSWRIEVVDDLGDTGKFSSLALGEDDQAHVAYLSWRTPGSGMIMYAHRSGDVWLREEVASVDDITIAHIGARRMVTLVLDAAGRPQLAFCDRRSLRFAVRDQGSWHIETVAEPSAQDRELGQLASLALDSDGSPHIAFYELPANPTSSLGTVYHASGPAPGSVLPAPRRVRARLVARP